jgi:hypothetical protein
VVLNGARGSMKTKLHADLERPMLNLIERATCESKEKVLWAYTQALVNTNAWPVEIKSRSKSISELHAALDRFKSKNAHPSDAPCKTSNGCSLDFDDVVKKSVRESRDYFDGLCLGELPTVRSPLPM